MAMIGKIRRYALPRQKKSVREIARMTSLSRNTVAQVAAGAVPGTQPKYRRGEAADAS